MTLLQTFTDSFPKNSMVFFSDFIGEPRPFGVVKTNNATIGIPTDVYTNGNSDGLGEVTCTLGTGTSGSAYQRIGLWQSVEVLNGLINRQWSLLNGEYEFECRIKTSVHPSSACIVTCGYILNHNTNLQNGAYFYHMNGQSTWRAAVSAEFNIIAEFDTGIPVSSYSILGVTSVKSATEFKFLVNGKIVWKWTGSKVASEITTGAYPMPHMEMRDRVPGGGQRGNSFTADYMMTEERIVR